MIRNLKTLVLALSAVFALGGLMVSSASATSIWFEGEEGIQTVTAEQEPETEDVLSITNGSKVMKCKHVHYTNETSTVTTTQSEISLTPTYSECSASFPFILRLNGCDYRFYNFTTNGSGQRTANTQITCPTGNQIETDARLFGTLKCLITFGPQAPAGHVVFTNTGEGSNRDITTNFTLGQIHYTEHAGTGFGACASGAGTDGTYSGVSIIKGRTHSGVPKGVWIDP